jgi:hypothetical protein
MMCCWISWCFFWQYHIVQVCILGIISLYYTFFWLVPCFYSPYACTYAAVWWWKCRFSNTKGETIGANLFDHLFFYCCFVLLWFYFAFIFVCLCRIINAKSLFTCVVFFFLLPFLWFTASDYPLGIF